MCSRSRFHEHFLYTCIKYFFIHPLHHQDKETIVCTMDMKEEVSKFSPASLNYNEQRFKMISTDLFKIDMLAQVLEKLINHMLK